MRTQHDKSETNRSKSEGTGGSDAKNAETGSAGKDGSHDAKIAHEPAAEEVGVGNEERKSAATAQIEQGEAGDFSERPGNEPLSHIADATSRGGTRGLPGGAEGGKPAEGGDGQVHGVNSLEDRVAALEEAVARLQRHQKNLGL